MKKYLRWTGVLALLGLLGGMPVYAADVTELERRIDILSDELEEMRTQGGTVEPDRVTVHGYGEMHFNHRPQGKHSEVDLHRFVIGVHALLADWIHLNAEIDFEHAAQELEFEFGYLDFLLTPHVNARAGVVLIPVGFLNEFHEPPLFWTVERPELQTKVIPTTWSGAGAGVYGTLFDGFTYRLYAVNSLQSVRPDGFGSGHSGVGGQAGRFRASDGIRKGRLQIDEAIAEDFAATGRAEYSKLFPGLQVGFSFFVGNTTQGFIPEGGLVVLLEGDLQYRFRWFEMDATIVNIDIDDAAAMNDFTAAQAAIPGSSVAMEGTVPERIFGWNIEGGIHVLELLGRDTSQDLVVFLLYENFDLQAAIPSGCVIAICSNDPSKDTEVYTFGISYLPIPDVALKMDYQHFLFGNNKSTDQFNMGVAFMY